MVKLNPQNATVLPTFSSLYHPQRPQGTNERLGEAPALRNGVLPHLQDLHEALKPWINVHQPAGHTTQKQT